VSAIQQLLTDHIDIWTAAETEKKSGRGRASGSAASVYGIKKLREFILELAVRGKLVPQDASDEPTGELLERIKIEKVKLIAEDQIKKDKSFDPISSEEIPFQLPQEWKWVRIGQIGHDWGQKLPESDFTYIEVSAIDNKRGVISSPELVEPENAPSRARKLVKNGTLIYSTIRPYLLNIAVVEEDFFPEPIASTAFAVVHPFCSMPPRYFLFFLRSPVFVRYVESVQMGIAYPAINDRQFFSGLIPLPPIEEQHRIVAKVDELMILCDQLEAQHSDAADAHEQVVSHLLGTLTQSQSAVDFNTNWQRIARHFDTLFSTEASIDALKHTLLQLAFMGKLVAQDVNDEPVNELLRRIHAEKAKLVTERKIKKDKLLAPSVEGESPYSIPSPWKWVTLDEISQVGTGATPLRTTYEYFNPPSISWVTSGETSSSFIFNTEQYVSPLALKETNLTIYPRGTLIVAMYGQGKTRGQITELMIDACTNQACAAIQLYSTDEYHRRYVKLYFEKIYEEIRELAAGGAQPNLNLSKIKETRLPLPPLSEQQRIVAKLDEFMGICDQLRSCIANSNLQQKKLADALVEQAVGA
jgi:type I restriction enzyme S subunit